MTIDTMANVILNNCDEVSNKKLQKLSYYVYSWYLTIYGRKIADARYEAWEHGPVCRRLYNKYKKHGWNVIPKYEGFVLANDEEIQFIQSVISIYGDYTADELERMTHLESPWLNARAELEKSGLSDVFISDSDIMECYSNKTDIKNMLLEKLCNMRLLVH